MTFWLRVKLFDCSEGQVCYSRPFNLWPILSCACIRTIARLAATCGTFPFHLRSEFYRLSPLDLAISKLSRFQQVDVEDIEALIKKEKIARKRFLMRYTTARAYYTNPKETDFNVRLLIRKVYGEEFDPKKDLPKPRGGV